MLPDLHHEKRDAYWIHYFIDKFNDCVIKLNFNNIFITYIVSEMEQVRERNGFSIY